jgi:hypothetical protein
MVKIKCEKHPRFKGNKPPKAGCEECMAIYEIVLKATAARLKVS